MRERLRIVSTGPLPAVARSTLEPLGDVIVMNGRQDRSLAEADVLIVRADRIDEDFLAAAPGLRAIARTGKGLDMIDLQAVSRRRIPLVYAPDAGTLAIAEGTLALILASLKRVGELNAVVSENRWHERYDHDVLDIAETVIGVVGFGRIGREVARLAQALGMEVIAYDPDPRALGARTPVMSVTAGSLREVFARADVITLHCPLNERTRHLVDRKLLAMTKAGAILVNASRGGLIAGDEVLFEALESGRLSGVALDVYEREPPAPASALLRDPRVICTPHTVGLTRAWNREVFGSLVRDLRCLVRGERPAHIANPEVLDELQS